MQTVTITTPVLPDVLPTDHQELMNIFYAHWQKLNQQVCENNKALDENSDDIFVNPKIEGMLRSPTQDEIASVMPPKIVVAVMLGNHNYQVLNGGWMQWDGNGYSHAAEKLAEIYEAADRLGIEGARDLHEMTAEFIKIQNDFQDDDDEDDDVGYNNPYDNLDARYYEVDREGLMQAILDRFDEVCAMTMLKGVYRRAA